VLLLHLPRDRDAHPFKEAVREAIGRLPAPAALARTITGYQG
jgi:hypothetical protein